MLLKSINHVEGYKDLPDGFFAEFDEDTTYIVGANFKGKTTVGSLFSWCLTGTSLYGNEKEQVSNDRLNRNHVLVDMTFIDNYGIEHRLIREKGKKINLILDGKEIKQEMLAPYYQDKDIFLSAHNPYYFASLEPKVQKALIQKIIPDVSPTDAFALLTEEEQKIIGGEIEIIGSYIDKRNEAISELKKEYDENTGKLQAYERIVLQPIAEKKTFDKEKELEELTDKYAIISANIGESNINDLQRSIVRLDEKLKEIIEDKLNNLRREYSKEKLKLTEINNKKAICSTCGQEIKNEERKEYLKKFYQNELTKFQEKADKLKEEANYYIEEKQKKQKLLEQLKTADTQRMQEDMKTIKEKISQLQEEQNTILLYNNEIKVKEEQIKKAKEDLELTKKAQLEITKELELNDKQKKIANKLRRLIIEEQKEKINQYLDKVDLQFCRENKSNDNITECCDIHYEGREYKKLSKSQQARACLEIANLFNHLSGMKVPIFLDDAESITNIPHIENTQMFISLVMKYNPLEILYDYSEVLERKKKSIEREYEEKDEFVLSEAA